MKRIKDLAAGISLSIAALFLVLIMHIVTAHAEFLFKFGSYGSGDGQFLEPHGPALDSSGNIYVADNHNNRIQVFDSSGNFLRKFGSFGGGDGQFWGPWGIALDSSGNIYVADTDDERFQVFDEIVLPPTVTSTSPVNNATDVAANTVITATFSEPMTVSTITTSTFIVSDGSGDISGTVFYSGTTATFTPSSNLSYSAMYTAKITSEVKDTADTAMASDYTWSFMTSMEPPTL